MRYVLALIFSISAAYGKTDCKIVFDSMGIPHLETKTKAEMYYCFGYLHGHDRAWPMDFLRRIGQGRNAEVLGYDHLKSDLMMRLLNLPLKAEELWSKFSDDKKQIIQSYVDGVNEGFKTGKNAQEFLDLGYAPEPWTPINTLTVLLTQSFDQTRKTFFKDYQEEKTKEIWGEKAEKLFDHDGLPWETTILNKGEYVQRSDAIQTVSWPARSLKLWGNFPEIFGESSGSNNWVVSSKKSKTGHAILANDPHLDLKTPMFWYWIHLKSSDGEIIGASLPGVPLIVAGTNGKVAWGITNSYMNTSDVAFLKDEKDEWFESIRPTVWVKLGPLKLPFFFKSFERLKSGGPVVPLETERNGRLVLRWTGFELTPEDVYPLLDFIHAKNIDDMDGLLKKVGVPSWNLVFADIKGDIGYRMVGKSYRQNGKSGFGIPTQTLEEFKNVEFLRVDEIPHVVRPQRQYIHTANNRHFPPDASLYGGRGYSHSLRAYRIGELIEAQSTHDLDSMKSIQCDRQVVDARFFIPKLVQFLRDEQLSNWDMLATDNSLALPLYRRLMDIIMDEWKVDEYALYRLLGNLDKQQQQQLSSFYERAVKEVDGRDWGTILRLGFPHLSNNAKWTFSPELPGVGDTHSVDPGSARWNVDKKRYEQFSGASMRMVIEMNQRPKIVLVLPGHNREYTKKSEVMPWQDWRECKYSEINF